MRDSLGDKVRLNHIHECIIEIEKATKGLKEEAFVANHIIRIAVVKWLEIIGESANHITGETKARHPDINWISITSLRNFVVHEYFGINFSTIWKIVTDFVPILKSAVENLLKELD